MKIKLENINKTYGNQRILKDVSLAVDKGTLLSILGESGAGKTTILRAIAGLIAIDSGRIMIGDSDVTDLPVEKRDIGYIFQAPLLFPHLTVEENICFGLEVKKWGKASAVFTRLPDMHKEIRRLSKEIDKLNQLLPQQAETIESDGEEG